MEFARLMGKKGGCDDEVDFESNDVSLWELRMIIYRFPWKSIIVYVW